MQPGRKKSSRLGSVLKLCYRGLAIAVSKEMGGNYDGQDAGALRRGFSRSDRSPKPTDLGGHYQVEPVNLVFIHHHFREGLPSSQLHSQLMRF